MDFNHAAHLVADIIDNIPDEVRDPLFLFIEKNDKLDDFIEALEVISRSPVQEVQNG